MINKFLKSKKNLFFTLLVLAFVIIFVFILRYKGKSPEFNNGNFLGQSAQSIDKKEDIASGGAVLADKSPATLKTVMAWVYPGAPSCNAKAEISDGRKIDIIKAEYFRVDMGGILTFLDEEGHGCNGFSQKNLELIKANSTYQYVTVASSDASFMRDLLVRNINNNGIVVETLVNFVLENQIEGVELDFEDFGNWSNEDYKNFKIFVRDLGNRLRSHKKKLMIDGPAVSNATEENWYVWRYEDFLKLPVDYMVVMVYDYQFDHGVGSPVAPLDWMSNVIKWVRFKFSDTDRLVIGIPSYGYQGSFSTGKKSIATYDQISSVPGFSSATRDERSGEMSWRSGDKFYLYQDETSINLKIEQVLKEGISQVSIWHLGGNKWFDY